VRVMIRPNQVDELVAARDRSALAVTAHVPAWCRTGVIAACTIIMDNNYDMVYIGVCSLCMN